MPTMKRKLEAYNTVRELLARHFESYIGGPPGSTEDVGWGPKVAEGEYLDDENWRIYWDEGPLNWSIDLDVDDIPALRDLLKREQAYIGAQSHIEIGIYWEGQE
jgi:hypothetical protein